MGRRSRALNSPLPNSLRINALRRFWKTESGPRDLSHPHTKEPTEVMTPAGSICFPITAKAKGKIVRIVSKADLYVNRYPPLKFGKHRRLVAWEVHA